MWKDFTDSGAQLANPEFLETVTALKPYFMLRSLGGTLFIIGALVMV